MNVCVCCRKREQKQFTHRGGRIGTNAKAKHEAGGYEMG